MKKTKSKSTSVQSDFNYNDENMKRIKTFAWSLLWVGVAALVDHTISALGGLNLPNFSFMGTEINTTVILGLVLAQISKYVSNMRKAGLV